MTLHRLIGLKSFKVSGFSTFGMRTMAVSLTPLGIVPDTKNSFTAAIIYGPIMLQFLWNILAGKPSGPGALRGPSWNIASATSLSVKGAQSLSFISAETRWVIRLTTGSAISVWCAEKRLLKYCILVTLK